jgi:hypothetical protein
MMLKNIKLLISHPLSRLQRSVFVLFTRFVVTIVASLFDLNLAFLLAGSRIQYPGSDQTAGQVDRWEIISASDLFEPNNSVLRDSVNKQNDGGQHLNLELCNEEG